MHLGGFATKISNISKYGAVGAVGCGILTQ